MLVGARDPGRGAAAVQALTADGIDARPLALDVDDDASVAAAASAIERDFGVLDVLVNNAAVKLETSPSPPSERRHRDRTGDVRDQRVRRRSA